MSLNNSSEALQIPALQCQTYSTYAARILSKGQVSTEQVLEVMSQFPLDQQSCLTLIQSFLDPNLDAEASLVKAMRRARSLLMLALCEYDLLNPPTEQTFIDVSRTISIFAECVINLGLDALRPSLIEKHGDALMDAQNQSVPSRVSMPLWVMGMGKLSGYELNVSSDIDLIFVYHHEGETEATSVQAERGISVRPISVRPISYAEFFDRLGKRLIKLLDDVTEDGFVFRVDMRLRPNGASGPLVIPLSSLEKYFYLNARTWERFAWLKSRLLNPSPEADGLKDLVRSFVFRRYLDFDAIDAIRELHHKIAQKAKITQANNQEQINIKVGPGGIREIEFYIQLQQIIRGAKQPLLQTSNLLLALSRLEADGWVSYEQMQTLKQSYVFLRHTEHRIQYIQDAQTHLMPSHPQDLQKLSQAMRFADAQSFSGSVDQQRQSINDIFNQSVILKNREQHSSSTQLNILFDPQNDEMADIWNHFVSPNELQDYFAKLEQQQKVKKLPEKSQTRLKRLFVQSAQNLIMQLREDSKSSQSIPNEKLMRIWNFIESISSRSSYLALLDEYPNTLVQLVDLLKRSKWCADYLQTHPILLDELLYPERLAEPIDWSYTHKKLEAILLEQSKDRNAMELSMDTLREFHHANLFTLLIQEIKGVWSVEALADELILAIEIILNQALQASWRLYPKKHQEQPALAVIAYGKLGGKEMGFASDLDLVFVYEDDHPEAPEIYARFAQILNNWLTAPTGAGDLFETDYRLRPNGDSGLMVVSMTMYEKYLNTNAWFWEIQALTRARFCVGDTIIGKKFEQIRRDVLSQSRSSDMVKTEISTMLKKIKEGHPNRTTLFDLKYDDGGMVDLEFCVQYLVLTYAHQHPIFLENLGNIALLEHAGKLNLIDMVLAKQCTKAYRSLRQIQYDHRLQNIYPVRIDPALLHEYIHAIKTLVVVVLGENDWAIQN